MGRVKGSIFVKVVKGVRAARARERVPAPLRHHLDQHVLVSSWFEEQDYLALMRVLAEVLPDPGLDIWEWMGRDAARVDYQGLYKAFLEGKEPAGALKGFQILWPLRHDTGKVSVRSHGPGRAVVELQGYALTADEIYRSIQGTIWQTLHMAGARDIRIERVTTPAPGARTAPAVRWEASWSE